MKAPTAVYMCSQHQFVIEVTGDEASCRRSPGWRHMDCEECDKAVDDSFRQIGWKP